MNIGFFGDSYVDFIWHNYPGYSPIDEEKTWSYRLIEDMGCSPTYSGMGGTNLYYAIDCWEKYAADPNKPHCDYAIFSFTWKDRLFSGNPRIQNALSASAELRESDDEFVEEVKRAVQLYREYLNSHEQTCFFYDRMVHWIMQFPEKHPDTKFIFVPNTEFSRQYLLKYFNKGILLNFTLEQISNLETGSPGNMPIDCKRIGHMRSANHEAMKVLMRGIIENYSMYENTIVDPDLSNFDLVSIPTFPR
jgi:hypothetical protein